MATPGPNLVAVETDTDESEASSFSNPEEDDDERRTDTPLVAPVSDSEEDEQDDNDNEQETEIDTTAVSSSMQDIDDDDDDDDDDNKRGGSDGEEDEDEEDEIAFDPDEPIIDEFTDATPLPCISDEPAERYEWNEIVLARICLFGNPETCVQAMVMQTKDGTESGCADKSVSRNDLTKERIKEEYQLVRQPMGYVTRVTGYHSKAGKPCLLHSMKLQFASGQVIELQGETHSYKGEAFVVQNLADNFYLSTIDFEEGKCIGYSGYHTDRPLRELMEEESLPDEEALDAAQESDDEDGDGLPKPRRSKPKMKAPTGDDDGSWVTDSLPAREMPQPPPDEDDTWRVSHVCICGGPCVRGCIIHYYDGERFGYLLKEDLQQASIHDHAAIENANGNFVEVQQPGGYITKINGYQMLEDGPHYLCHSLQLEFASGQVIEFLADPDADVWKGKYFSYTPPDDFYVYQLKFDGDGHLSSVVGIRTEEMDFPPMESPEVQEGKKKCCPCCPCLPC